jgi:TolA-binding protein
MRAAAIVLFAHGLPAQADRQAENFHVAMGLMQRGLHDEAARQLERFLREHGEHELAAEAHYRLACCRLELGERKNAIPALRRALQMGGDAFALHPECRYRLAGALQAEHEHRAAVEVLETLLARVGGDHYLRASAEYARGEALRELKDDAGAAAAFLAAAAAAKPDANLGLPARYQAGFALLRLGRFDAAEQEFRTAAEHNAGHGRVLVSRR